MTAGEQLIEQGRQQGIEQGLQQGIEQSIEQGLQQGIEEGRQQGKRELLLRVLRRRFGNAMNHEAERRFASAPITQIDAWVERVFSAATVTEFLAD